MNSRLRFGLHRVTGLGTGIKHVFSYFHEFSFPLIDKERANEVPGGQPRSPIGVD